MSIKDIWNEEAAAEKKFTAVELPEGTYKAEVLKCEFGKTNAGSDKVLWELKITEGEYINSHSWIHSKFSRTDESEENRKDISKMLAYFKALDLPCSSDKIAESMAGIVGKNIEFKIVAGSRGGMFTNFVRVVPAVATTATPIAADNSAVPF